ncbi:MAG: TetR/AcrR family transcriptional regulator [Pseudooceanicola sp.]
MTTNPTRATATAPPAPRKAGRVSRKDEIARIAVGLFARHGFDGTSIRDIANAAGLTKPALYYHFQDKEALYEHLLVERMTRLIASVREAVVAETDPIARIRAYIATHAGRMDQDRDGWLMSRQSFLAMHDVDRRQRVTGLRDEFERILRELFMEAIRSGSIDADTDPALVTRLVLSSVNDVPRWLKPKGGLTAREVASNYLDITLRGLGAKV